jgi:glucose-1-phosphate cytidylyltransferase
MKVVILCGGKGTRLSEETVLRPKPMVHIGDRPILWHIMKQYASFGFTDFVLALGHKGASIKEYFLNFNTLNSDFSIDLHNGKVSILNSSHEDWKVALVDTGEDTLTGGRIARLKSVVGNESFFVTYGDGVSDLNIKKLLDFHQTHGKTATVTSVRPPSRFGEIIMKNNQVTKFAEKPQTAEGWINGGYFVFNPEIFNYLEGDECVLERSPLESLSSEGELMAFAHEGFWQCMDTLRDKMYLNSLLENKTAPWVTWKS